MAVNFGFYVFFCEVLGIYYIVANVLAIELSVLNNFILNERWTFRDRDRGGWKTYFKRMLAFHLSSGLIAWLTQTPTLFILTHYFRIWDKLAVMIGIGLGALANYFICNLLIFKHKTERR